MKFKLDIYLNLILDFSVCTTGFLQIKKKQHYRGFGYIYAYKKENLQKTRVSATSCIFEYYKKIQKKK